MAEDNIVVKTIENVDKLFSQIVVNGEVFDSERYVEPEPKPVVVKKALVKKAEVTRSTVQTEPQNTTRSENTRSVQGENVYAVELNDILHNFEDRAIVQALSEEAQTRASADEHLQQSITDINSKIPSTASSSNKLADSASVGTSINNAIGALDVASAGGNGKYIKSISETDGKISAVTGNIDSSVNEGSSNPVTGGAVHSAIQAGGADAQEAIDSAIATEVENRNSAISSAISTEVSNRNTAISNAIAEEVSNRNTAISNAVEALDVASAGGNGKYIKAISETDGKISATTGDIDSSVTAGSSNPVTGGAVDTAINVVKASVEDIEALIPNQATEQNQLADKAFVNSSITSNTANFLGTYTSLAQIQAIPNPTNNDYAFLQTTDSAGNTEYQRYKYSTSDNQWHYEYTLNNSSFTAEQWATINSGLTQDSVTAEIGEAISGEVTARNSAISSAISTEVSNRNSAISNAIDEEVSNRNTAISNAVEALDVASAGGNGKYIKSISETDGKISATTGDIDSSVNSGSSNPVTGGAVATALSDKVDKVTGKGLSTNDFTNALKDKLNGIEPGAQVNAVTGVKGSAETDYRTGDISISKDNIGLGNVVNTGDSAVPSENGTEKFTTGGAYNSLLNLASAFSTSSDYAEGAYVLYNGSLYKCTQAHTAGAWDSTHFTSVSVGDELEEITDVAGSLPTDAVLHYSFDEVPDYPDGTAIEKHIKDFTSVPSGWDTNNRGVLSVANGELINTVTNGTSAWLRRYFASGAISGIVKIKVRVNIDCQLYVQYYDSTYKTLASESNAKANQEYTFTVFLPSTQSLLLQVYTPTAIDFQAVISAIYIGEGSYSTPIIDNANGQWNSTSQRGVAVQGVSGKGLKQFTNNEVVITRDRIFADNFTVSIWVKPDNNTVNLQGIILLRPNTFNLRNGTSNTVKMSLVLYPNGVSTTLTILEGLLPVKWSHLVIVKDGTKLKTYLDGELKTTNVLASSVLTQTDNQLTLNNNSNTRPQTYDDLLIFARALSDTEVLSLYQNKANTPRYFPTLTNEIKEGSLELATSGGVKGAVNSATSQFSYWSKKSALYSTGNTDKYIKIISAPTASVSRYINMLANRVDETIDIQSLSQNWRNSSIRSKFFRHAEAFTTIGGGTPDRVYSSYLVEDANHDLWVHVASYSKVVVELWSDSNEDIVGTEGTPQTNYIVNGYSQKDDRLVDDVTENSQWGITSGGVFNAVNPKQPKTLDTPVTVGGVQQTTVEGALGALAQASATPSVETGTVVTSMGSVPQGYLDCSKRMIEKFVPNGSSLFTNNSVISLLQTADGAIYAGGIGLCKSTDRRIFTRLSSIPANYGIYALLQTADGAVYAGSIIGLYKSGIYKSTDGNTFTQLSGFPTNASVRALLQTADGAVYAGTYENGLYKSTDGSTFTQLSGFPTSSFVITLLQTADGAIYAGTHSNQGIYKSIDGSTFTQLSGFPTSYDADIILQTTDGTIYVGTDWYLQINRWKYIYSAFRISY